MRSARYPWLLPFVAATAVSLVAARNRGAAARLSAALGFEQRKHVELVNLRAENRKLESGRLSEADQEQLESSHAALAALRERLAALQRKISEQGEGEPPSLPAKDWAYAGRATPKATIESVLWAASRGDVESLAGLLGFAPELRPRAEALFAQLPPASQQEYGTPEKVVATLLAGSFPKDPQAAQILVDHQFGDRDAAIAMTVSHSDGRSRTNQFQFHKASDGWKLLIPANIMEDYAKTLQGEQEQPESGPP